MLGDIDYVSEGAFGVPGSLPYQVAAGTTASISPGEPVVSSGLGAQYVELAATNMPVVGTDSVIGIATSFSTETASVDGKVQVMKLVPGVVYLGNPTAPTSWDTQAEYDANVGKRVLWDLTTGTFTILAADGANNGLVVENLDVRKNPGKVAFSIRIGAGYLA